MGKILFIIPGDIKTHKKGFEKLLFERIKYSSLKIDFEIVCLTPLYKKTEEYIETIQITKVDGKENLIKIRYFKNNIIDFFSVFIGILRFRPLQCILYQNQRANHFIDENQDKYKKIIFVTARSAQGRMPKNFIMDFVDSLSLNFSRKSSSTNNIFLKVLYGYEVYALKKQEVDLHKHANLCFSVSSIDASRIGKKTIALPLSIRIPNAPSKEILKKVTNSIVFSGNFSYEPNIKAIEWFIEHCFPLIYQKNNAFSLYLVGRNAHNFSPKLGHLPIVIVGEVKDMFEELSKYEVAIAPMQSGSGMQYKILEAMSVGTPVVTTSLGLGDIKAVPNKDIIVADKPGCFAQAIIDIVGSTKIKTSLNKNSKKYIGDNHNITKNSEEYFKKMFD